MASLVFQHLYSKEATCCTGLRRQSTAASTSAPLHATCHARRPNGSAFFGQTLVGERAVPSTHRQGPPPRLPAIAARIKRRKDPQLDKVIERDKKVRIVTKVKELICKKEKRVMSLKELGLYRRFIGLKGRRRLVVLLRRYPGVFEVFDQGAGQVWFRLTRAAEEQYLREQALRNALESILVDKIRKLLMMSLEKRLSVLQLTHLRRDLGLPEDFKMSILPKYPEFFRVKDTLEGTMLELTSWDPRLAVSALEHKQAKEAAQLDQEARAAGVGPMGGERSEAPQAGAEEVDERDRWQPGKDGPSQESGYARAAEGDDDDDRWQQSGGETSDSDWERTGGGEAGESVDGRKGGGDDGTGSERALSAEEMAMAAIARGKALVGAGSFGFSTDPERHKRTKRVSLKLPPGYSMPRKELKQLQRFLDSPFVSPYADPTDIAANSLEAEKRNVAIVHEMLSLTLEKRLLCDHFTHFRKPYRMTQRLHGMIIRHPEYFYLSEKGLRDSVFLREAYDGGKLSQQDPLVGVTNELRELVWLGKKAEKLTENDLDAEEDDWSDGSEEDESDDDVEESDVGESDVESGFDSDEDEEGDVRARLADKKRFEKRDVPPRGWARGAAPSPPVHQGKYLVKGMQEIPSREQPYRPREANQGPKEKW